MKYLLSALICLSFNTMAQTMDPPQEFKNAFQACQPTVKKDSAGMFDRAAMKACMESKGVKMPEISPEQRVALKSCYATVKKDPEGRPELAEMKLCMDKKGVVSPVAPSAGSPKK